MRTCEKENSDRVKGWLRRDQAKQTHLFLCVWEEERPPDPHLAADVVLDLHQEIKDEGRIEAKQKAPLYVCWMCSWPQSRRQQPSTYTELQAVELSLQFQKTISFQTTRDSNRCLVLTTEKPWRSTNGESPLTMMKPDPTTTFQHVIFVLSFFRSRSFFHGSHFRGWWNTC